MPAVAVAIASAMVAEAATAYFASQILGAIVGGLVSMTLSAAFSDSPDQSGQQQFVAELRDNMVTVRQPISHWQYIYGRTRVAGALTFAHESADDKLHLVITFAGHVSEEIEAIQFNDEVVELDGNGDATGTYAGYVRIKKSLGDEAGQPFPDLVAESEDKWTDAHRQSGRTKIYVRLTFNADVFPTGIPNITAVIKGRKVHDPRSGLTAWSDNPSLCIADFLCDSAAGLGCVYASEIDETQLIAAANIDDEAVALAAGGTEARYTLNGSCMVNVEPRATLGRLLTANAGQARYIGGVWCIHPAAYVTPTITLDEDDLRAVPHIRPRLSASDLSNAVKGLYVSEDNLWQPTDFPPVTNSTYLAEDNDERSWRELDLPYTKSAATAQRIAKIELERMRQQISVDWPGKMGAYRLQPGDTVKISFGLLGWTEKVFEVDQSALAFKEEDGGIQMGTDLILREIASTVFDWSSGEETVIDPAPDTNLPSPWAIAAPGTPSVTEALFETTGSAGVKARATMAWVASADIYTADYLPEYRVAGGDWVVLPATNGLAVDINDVAPGLYEFRLRARNAVGVRSAYSGTLEKEILGLTAPPADVTGFYVVPAAGRAWAQWSLHADLDVRIGGRIVIRHASLASGATWEDGVILHEFSGGAVGGPLPLLAGTYMAKAQDSIGNWSGTMVSFYASDDFAHGWTVVSTQTESPTFTGTKTNVAVVSSELLLDSASLVDAMTDLIDDWSSIDTIGGIQAIGSYAFASTMDLTTVAVRNFVVDLTAAAYDTGDAIDSRTTEVDAWDAWDGATINDCNVTPYIRVTPDNPAGSPTWGAWTPFWVADFNCRAAQFRLDFQSGNRSHNISVTALAVRAREFA